MKNNKTMIFKVDCYSYKAGDRIDILDELPDDYTIPENGSASRKPINCDVLYVSKRHIGSYVDVVSW